MKKLFLWYVPLAISCSYCGHQDESPNPSLGIPGQFGQIKSWESSCIASQSRSSVRKSLIFYENHLETLTNRYSTENCSARVQYLSFRHKYQALKVDQSFELPSNWEVFSTKLDDIYLTVSNKAVIEQFNLESAYGADNWKMGVAKRVTGLSKVSSSQQLEKSGMKIRVALNSASKEIQLSGFDETSISLTDTSPINVFFPSN